MKSEKTDSLCICEGTEVLGEVAVQFESFTVTFNKVLKGEDS